MHNKFGSIWTVEKLDALKDYLISYLTIMKKHPFFKTWYIDAFAGTGMIEMDCIEPITLFDENVIGEINQFISGSVKNALDLEPSFDNYMFIEKDKKCFSELERTVEKYKDKSLYLVNKDANDALKEWINEVSKDRNRAVIFLDPYGMSLQWSTIEEIAHSEIMDTWILFPLGTGVNRLLKTDGEITFAWQKKLDTFFGTHEWFDRFYSPNPQPSLFDTARSNLKVVTQEHIGYYFYERLSSIFCEVAPYCGILENSKNSPLYLFFFAAGNRKGANAGIKIANYLIKKRFKKCLHLQELNGQKRPGTP